MSDPQMPIPKVKVQLDHSGNDISVERMIYYKYVNIFDSSLKWPV